MNFLTATDYLIQQTLRQHFSDCTVITIEHHITSVLDSNIEELKAARIRLSNMKGISFSWETFKIPPVIVDDLTKAKLLNIFFLDLLIDQAQDVKELRECRILQNALGSDKEVPKLFNKIWCQIRCIQRSNRGSYLPTMTTM